MSNVTRTSARTSASASATRRTTAIRLTLSDIMEKHFGNLFSDDYGTFAQVMGYETKSVFMRNGRVVSTTTRSFTVEISYADGLFAETNSMSLKVVRRYLDEKGFFETDIPA